MTRLPSILSSWALILILSAVLISITVDVSLGASSSTRSSPSKSRRGKSSSPAPRSSTSHSSSSRSASSSRSSRSRSSSPKRSSPRKPSSAPSAPAAHSASPSRSPPRKTSSGRRSGSSASSSSRSRKPRATEEVVGRASPQTTLTLLADNPYKAKCLDGSPPGYYFRPGVGAGASNWLIDLPVGGWCTTVAECAERAKTEFGSTRRWPKVLGGGSGSRGASAVADAIYQISVLGAGVSSSSRGILSTDPNVNPTFHNWNLVRFVYCDGGGYAGRVRWKPVNKTSIVYMDGWRISKSIFMDLRARRGLGKASKIIMSGSSAGGQAVVTLCDQLAEIAPAATTKCIMDSGFFIDAPDRRGAYSFRATAQRIVGLHQSLGNPRCQRAFSGAESWRCFFPQYSLQYVRSPIFILQSLFDVRAYALGNQLPQDIDQASACVYDILKKDPNVGRAIKSRTFRPSRVPRSQKCPSESIAVLNAANEVYNAVHGLMLKKPGLTAFLPGNSQHTYTFNPSWEFVAINGTTVKAAVDEWVNGSPRYSRLVSP